ncbi:MAG: sigma-70 family RNA polymerase sigma factor [Polyangiales bacterium]|nr:sigma-70 family RNA polymerase sigma factor [Sandaracinaceae bacterium]
MTDSSGRGETAEERARFERLFRENVAYVIHTLRRLGVREADLEDVAHEVFLVVHRKWADYDPSRPLKPWLFGIAMRCGAAQRRRASVRRELPTDPQAHTALQRVGTPADSPELAERRALVHRALEFVHESRRPVLILHDLDGVSMPDIVAELGIPLNTGYSRLRLARAEMRETLKALSGGELP